MLRLVDELRGWPYAGEELEDEWEGARGLHFWNDRYRLIWEVDEEIHVVVLLRVGPKRQGRTTIYEEPRPERPYGSR